MTSIPVKLARTQLNQLIEEATASHAPIQITGKRNNAVLLAEEDWRSIQETLHLLDKPGMCVSIRKGMAEPLRKTSAKLVW
ncbi:MAG: type II toxin-antitoxin system Phd/YefM family antitoxin [Opitutae bacterium]|nr:type II toxin-antitoxin system Phd/YefM family antitoxin [Opitutae bacterium]